MNRRNFIAGLVASVSATEALVRLAQPGEAQALVRRNVLLQQAPIDAEWADPQQAFYGDCVAFIETRDGFKPIGYITDVSIEAHVTDMMSVEGTIQLVQGIKRGTARFSRHF